MNYYLVIYDVKGNFLMNHHLNPEKKIIPQSMEYLEKKYPNIAVIYRIVDNKGNLLAFNRSKINQ